MKKYELSLSRNYVSSWGIKEAIRELLQNAKDSNGEDIIDIDKSSGTITITNKNTSIPSSTLLLGNTSICLGIWNKENPMIKKEGNKMLESMNLIDLYANKHKESIEKEAKEKIKKKTI